ncbi:MAG: pilus assembly protein [Acidisphaera sp.]|nr:pilus assembly protein [Acidisphaera sp.]
MAENESFNAPPTVERSAAGRVDRAHVLAFVTDPETEAVLREVLVDAAPQGLDVRRGDIRVAVAALHKMPTPKILIVDVSGEEQPFTALANLSDVVEPDVRVLVVGDQENVNFYRQVTRGLGALEYLYKPLTRDMVARFFGPLVMPQAAQQEAVHGGRVVTITGVRGGVGATTIAANLAWYFGVGARRHTVLLDPDLHTGNAAMLLDAKAGSGLRTALEAPQRIDELFVERVAQPIGDRLHVLAGEERLTEQPVYAAGAAQRLLDALRKRYNFVVADVPFAPLQLYRDLLDHAHQRVLVMEPTLAGIREALRMLALPSGPTQPRRAVVVLNRLGLPGGLSRAQVEDALKLKPDVCIPYLPRQLGTAASMGEPEAGQKGGFRAGLIQLAREVAFVRLLDSSVAGKDLQVQPKPRRRLFGLMK